MCSRRARIRAFRAIRTSVPILTPDTLPADLMLGLFEADISVEDVWPEGSSQTHGLEDIDKTRAAGREWIENGRSCVVRVPSIVVPQKQNLVVNPLHAEAHRITLTPERRFKFDGRLL